MSLQSQPGINVDIVLIKGQKILLGLFSTKWLLDGKQVWGVPGKDLIAGTSILDAATLHVREDIDCELVSPEIFCVNENHAWGNHYIGIGILGELHGEPILSNAEDWERWEWFDLNDLPENLFPAAQNVIECYKQKRVHIEK